MKISESWLREWVNPQLDTQSLVDELTMAGLEVDAVEPATPAFAGVVVGKIESVEQHPDAEKLRVCQVSNGSESVQVVCGAPNAAAGMKVPFAQVGAKLPGDMKIGKAKLRGVESHGMLCGASELGLEDIVDGLLVLPEDAPPGVDVREYLNLDDQVIEVDLTPNRGDCLSVLGIAREVGVLTKTDLTEVSCKPVDATIEDSIPVSLNAPDYCPRYAGRVIRNVDLSRPTPLWMREKLRRSGLRSIDAVVDVTNYVLLELGQPMHAFDLEKIDSGIDVRMAAPNEKIKLLDGSDIELSDDYLVIADKSRALAIAGIMGGDYSAVTTETRHILLESAFFDPEKHAGKARTLGMHTDSSHRFERGVDLAGQERAIERATQLLLDIVGGEVGPLIIAEDPDFAKRDTAMVELKESRIQRVLGFSMAAGQVEDIFSRLGLIPRKTEAGWQVQVPSHRFDIAIEADLLEELARIYGYNNLPVEPPVAPMEFTLRPEAQVEQDAFRDLLLAKGYSEAITYSFIDPEVQQQFFPGEKYVELANPIASDMAAMRTSLLPGLVKAAIHNLSRQRHRLKLFETGLRFKFERQGEGGLKQSPMLAGLIVGGRIDESWMSKREAVGKPNTSPDEFDFYDLKGDVQSILALSPETPASGIEYKAVGDEPGCSFLHPGQSANILKNGEKIGVLGQLHPKLQQTLDISVDIWVFELDLGLISYKKVPKFKELSKFPEVRRDLSIVIDRSVSVGDVVNAARSSAPGELAGLVVFDQYSGKGIADNKQSMGLGLTWQHAERTLNDEEVNTLTDSVFEALEKEFDISLR